MSSTVKALYFLVLYLRIFPLEFNFTDFEFVTLLEYKAKMFTWYLISRKQFVRKIRKVSPTRNLRFLTVSQQGLLTFIFNLLHNTFLSMLTNNAKTRIHN